MFKTVNPYDEIVAKATDEKQTVENWDILLTVWDKVNDDGEAGARNCVNALQKRFSHRSANVQLFSLTLADALVNNCGAPLHREVSGKQFTQALSRLVQDRNTHDSVKRKALGVMQSWSADHKHDANFDLLIDTFDSLREQPALRRLLQEANDQPVEAARATTRKPRGNDEEELRKREEEDLQRALAESAALAESSSSKGPFRLSTSTNGNSESPFRPPPRKDADPEYVRALYDFAGSSPDELSLRKGEVVKIVECIYEEWWKGELRGRVGIFPSSYVERTEKPREAERRVSTMSSSKVPLTEAEMEAQLFAQSASIDRLLNMMRDLERSNENPAENEELLELYQQSMALRPRVVKLIEKYNQKQTDLRTLNDKFAVAKQTYDHMLEESMQRYRSPPQPQPAPYQQHHQHPGYGQPYGAAPYSSPAPPPQASPYGYPQQQQQAPGQQPTPQMMSASTHAPATSAPAPVHQQQRQQPQQQQQQPQAQQGPDPAVLAQMSPEQRQEYERQWAEYQVALAQYYASIGQQQHAPSPGQPAQLQHQPPQQQQQHDHPQGPPPVASASPAPSVQSTGIDRRASHGWPPNQSQQPPQVQPGQYAASGQPHVVDPAHQAQSPPPHTGQPHAQVQAQSQVHPQLAASSSATPQPYWDGQSWVYPVQTNVSSTDHTMPHHATAHSSSYDDGSAPPPHAGAVEQQLNGPMAAMSVNSPPPAAHGQYGAPQYGYAAPYQQPQ